MLFVAVCTDKAGMLDTRMSTRPTHLAWMESTNGAVKLAGPLLDPTGETPIGSMLIVEAADLAAAKALLGNDPYAKAGLFASTDVKPWRLGVGTLG